MSLFNWFGPKVEKEIKAKVNRGLRAGAAYLSGKVKETISRAAPRKRVVSKKTGAIYYRATTRAVPGAPPRKLSGQLRRSIAYEVNDAEGTARIGTNMKYARRHEKGNHSFLVPTLQKHASTIAALIAQG